MTRSKISLMKKAALAAVLVAATAGVANADDGDMGRFGDSYQYFASQPIYKAPSSYHAESPNGISELQLQAYSDSMGTAFKTGKPVFDKAPSEWRLANPNGLTEHDLQALSSEAWGWHSVPQAAGNRTAATQSTSNDTLAARAQ
jgi:hypothetical protein